MAPDQAKTSGPYGRYLTPRRESGEIALRKTDSVADLILMPDLPRLERVIAEQPDRTLAELQQALGTSASLATIWRAIERLALTLPKSGPRVRTGSRRRRRGPGGLAASRRRLRRPVRLSG